MDYYTQSYSNTKVNVIDSVAIENTNLKKIALDYLELEEDKVLNNNYSNINSPYFTSLSNTASFLNFYEEKEKLELYVNLDKVKCKKFSLP